MKKVLILFGGNSFEHEISCNSVNFIINNIDNTMFCYKLVGIDYDNNWYEVNNIKKIDKDWKNYTTIQITNINEYLKKFDIVFPMIHGNYGEDGKIQTILELNNIKYVGCNSYSSFICYDKLLTKLILEKHAIPQIPYYIYNNDLDFNKIQYPVIVKPCKCGSSIGINVAYNKNELKKAIKNALRYDKSIIIEKFIKNNKELECAILEKKDKLIVSNVGEILNSGKWYDYDAKYTEKRETKISNINNEIKKSLQKYSKKIFKLLQCKNLSRIDFIFDLDTNKLYFNEINTIPGFTEISMYPKLINDIGINYKKMLTLLLIS